MHRPLVPAASPVALCQKRSTPSRWLAALAIPLVAGASWLAFGEAAPTKLVALASEPLTTSAGGQKPTLALALSVEFPTVGAQYLNAVYTSRDAYIGYFDTESCYAYANDADAALRRFDRVSAAAARSCAGAGFSGNFLNWATSSAIDVLRLGLTGGDRIVDTPDMTVLQRAVLYRFSEGNFARKRLSAAEAAGALPSALRGDWKNDVFISNCLDRVEFGTGTTGTCMNPGDNSDLGVAVASAHGSAAPMHASTVLSADPFFYARVKVCESDASGRLTDPRESFCTRYPQGNFKPVGNLQKYSDRIRVAAFGYLMDSSQRYGGVLRAPMKFVGEKSYDAAGTLQAGNDRMEWDELTGIFRANPEGAAEGKSGVINYLNQFGRTGAVQGNYKVIDPVGELYYEALRYLQGLPPTPQATAGMTEAMKDGFPAYDRWDDPHAGRSPSGNYACLRNNILVIGDVNTHNDKSIPGNTSRLDAGEFARPANPAGNEPDFASWTRVVGGFESGVALPFPDDAAQLTSNPNPASDAPRAPLSELARIDTADTGADRASYYMAGIAYWANTRDIRGAQWTDEPAKQRPGMRVTTYVLDVNEGGADSNFANRRRKQFFLAAKYGGFKDKSAYGNPFVDEDGVLDNSSWQNASADGDPRNYHLSSSASAVIQGLDEIFASLASQSNSIAGGDTPSASLTPGQSAYTYQASFDPEGWSGDVLALPMTVDASDNVTAGSTRKEALWSAAERLDAATVDPANRNIVIGRVDATQNTANAFVWAALEGSAGGYSLKTLLSRATPGAETDSLGPQRLAFLRGDRSLEGSAFRKRTSRLGDIVNSGVAFSGAPTKGHASAGYIAFHEASKDRVKAVFAGANDGMLHAFDAATGAELFGYIPSWLGPNLSALAARDYGIGQHRSYVDSTPRVAEAEFADGSWKSVLVGGTGAGGQGVFALDVTNPAAFDASKVLWEFTDRDDPDLGNVTGRPQILRFRTSAAYAAGAPTYRTYVVVAGGVNNTQADGFASAGGAPAIFLLDVSKPVGTPWRLNANYFKLSIPTQAAVGQEIAPGVLDLNARIGPAGAVQSMYFGDLHGNLWKLDFSRKGSADWNTASLSPFEAGGVALPFFIAHDGRTGKVQPITMAPLLTSGPGQSVLVSFGTGKYLEPSDNEVSGTTQPQSIYTLYDNGIDELDRTQGSSAISGRARLVRGDADADAGSGDIRTPAFRWGRPMTDGDLTQRAGWYFDLPADGERQIGGMQNFGKTLVFGSLVPPTGAAGGCGAGASGGGRIYRVSLTDGGGKSTASVVGALGVPVVIQRGTSVHGAINSVGQGESVSRGKVVVRGTKGTQALDDALERRSTYGMLSWRRINNYQDLKNAKAD